MDSILDYTNVPQWLATGLELIIEHCFSNQIRYDWHYKTRVSAIEYRDNLINWNYTPQLQTYFSLGLVQIKTDFGSWLSASIISEDYNAGHFSVTYLRVFTVKDKNVIRSLILQCTKRAGVCDIYAWVYRLFSFLS